VIGHRNWIGRKSVLLELIHTKRGVARTSHKRREGTFEWKKRIRTLGVREELKKGRLIKSVGGQRKAKRLFFN